MWLSNWITPYSWKHFKTYAIAFPSSFIGEHIVLHLAQIFVPRETNVCLCALEMRNGKELLGRKLFGETAVCQRQLQTIKSSTSFSVYETQFPYLEFKFNLCVYLIWLLLGPKNKIHGKGSTQLWLHCVCKIYFIYHY